MTTTLKTGHDVGAGKCNRSLTLTFRALSILEDSARAAGVSVNQRLRDLICAGAEAEKDTRALALKAAMHVPVIAVGIVGIWLSFVGNDVRRTRTLVGVRVTRTARRTDLEEVLL